MMYKDQKTCILIQRNAFRVMGMFILVLLSGCGESNPEDRGEAQDPIASDLDTIKEKDFDEILTLPGFEVELLYEVPRKSQGTWVSLAMDEHGRMVASDQYN